MTKEAKVFLESVLPVLSAEMQLAIKTLVQETTANLANEEIKNMANREIVMRIPEDKYDRLMQQMRLDRNFNECEITELDEHGDLIDRQALINNGTEKGFCDWYDEIKYADTIIEASHPVPAKEQSQDRDNNLER